MSRSPTRLGSPAFGWIASGRLPAAGTICSSTPYKVLEPTEQFAPRAWTPSARNVRPTSAGERSEEHTSELQSRFDLVCRLLLEKKKLHLLLFGSALAKALSAGFLSPRASSPLRVIGLLF